jgi:hypothetical protein
MKAELGPIRSTFQSHERLRILKTVVAFLVINEIDELPAVSIRSVLENSESEIRVGYLNERDISQIAISPRVQFVKLQPIPNLHLSGVYKDFSESLFYQIVQLKWQLIQTLLDQDFEVVIYSDLDVIWISNPLPSLVNVFEQDPEIAVQIQSFTTEPDKPRLCMGFVAFRNNSQTREIISVCEKNHTKLLELNPRLGDDDVMTKYYIENNCFSKIRLLPQSTFPVGSFLNLYTTRPIFPGLNSPKPYIFHLNYVVGLQNKRIMLRLIGRRIKVKTSGMNHWFFLLLIKRLRFIFSTATRKLLALGRF